VGETSCKDQPWRDLTWADPAADLRGVLDLPPGEQMAAAARTLRPEEMEVLKLLRGPRNPLGLTAEERLHLLERWLERVLRALRLEGLL